MTNSIKDIEEAKTIFILGSNTFEDHPLIARRVVKAREHGAILINIDPRFTMTAKQADIYAPFFSGTDVALVNAMMNVIITEGLEDKEFIKNRTRDYEKMKEEVMKCTPEWAAPITGVPAETIRKVARVYATNKPSAIIYSMGVTQHACGTDNVLSMSNIAMLTGNIGKRGSGVNPLRGQNNVQGACDMGALPNVVSGYQAVINPELRAKVCAVWGVKDIPGKVGLTIVEVMNAIEQGKVKSLYIMGENPMISDPDINHVKHSLEHLDFLVVQDIFMTETAQLASVVLPAASFAEKDGTFTNTERRVQLLKPAVKPPGQAKPDWEIIGLIAKKMGVNGFDFSRRKKSSRRSRSHRVRRHDLREALQATGTPLAVPGDRSPRHPDPAHREVQPPGRHWHILPGNLQAARRGTRCGVPVDPDHRPHALPLPHGQHDPQVAHA
jgi:formate dehydrogenase major subunit